jgi:spore germination cell wall hydrolase CwlJ-like protein
MNPTTEVKMRKRLLGLVLAVTLATPAMAFTRVHEVTAQDIKRTAAPIGGQTQQDILCLAYSIFRESGTLPPAAQYAVGQIHINRLETGAWGTQLCQVVFAPAQFSWTLSPVRTVWSQQQMKDFKRIAINLVQGIRVTSLDNERILHYHANYVRPRWGNANNIVAMAGPHVFYRDIQH